MTGAKIARAERLAKAVVAFGIELMPDAFEARHLTRELEVALADWLTDGEYVPWLALKPEKTKETEAA